VEDGASAVTVQAASELTGARPGTIRHTDLERRRPSAASAPGGPPRGDREDRRGARRALRGLPAPAPADPLRLALDGDLRVALDRALAMAALRRLEAERRRLRAERRAVAEARQRLLGGA